MLPKEINSVVTIISDLLSACSTLSDDRIQMAIQSSEVQMNHIQVAIMQRHMKITPNL